MSRDVDLDEAAPAANFYHQDFYSWTQEQAKLLRARRLDAIDVANILEEIATLGRSERASLKSAYRLICSHLLKMKYRAPKYSRSWHNTVDRERSEVVEILAENPGLRPSREDTFAKAYALGRKDAARETRLPLDTFPERSPFTRAECESANFVPQEVQDHIAARKLGVGKARKPKRKVD